MKLFARRPSHDVLAALADSQRDQAVTYAAVGMTELDEAPTGYRRDLWRRSLGAGDDVFERALATLAEWGAHTGAGLEVAAEGPPTVGDVVGIAAPLPAGYVGLACRVVAVVDEPEIWSFTYGTLPEHPEEGEECFAVRRAADGEITFEIVVVWRSRHPLARLAPPITRRLQRSATIRYLDAMSAAVL